MKKMLYPPILIFMCLASNLLFAQNAIRKVTIDINSYRSQLTNTPNESVLGIGNAKNSETIISLPLPDGSSANFRVIEYSILPKGINVEIKTYLGEQVDDPSVGCRLTITKDQMTATILSNGQIISIEKDQQSTVSNSYHVFFQTNETFECEISDAMQHNGRISSINRTQSYTNGTNLRIYRMAIIVTNEFYLVNGNNDASINVKIAGIINSLNGIYEKEIAVRLTLVSPTNPASSNVFYRKLTNINEYYQDVDQTRVEMNTRFGTANYDLGHTLHYTGGGVAYFGVCNDNYKGGGWSGGVSPSSVLLMAHEVGHQFTANHTFNGNGSTSCNKRNRNTATAFEPGSGSTIMSYFGLCAISQNLTGIKESYFHTNSLDAMINYIQTGTGNTCGTPTPTGNTPPVVNAGAAYTIPKDTPFTLIGSGSDINGDKLTYTWEEYDVPMESDSGKLGHTNNAVTSTTAPLFRSKQSLSPIRNFPDMKFVLNNSNNPPDKEGEDLPNVGRTMVFRLTARDNRADGGGVNMSSVTITVDGNKGPLAVILPNGGESWTAGSLKNITWNVNNTNVLSDNVKVLLSINGGLSFPYTLAASTANNGTLAVTIPTNLPNTTKARIKIVSTNSSTAEFFDVSNADFTITSNCNALSTFICPDNTITENSGSSSFNLNLSKVTGSLCVNNSKTVSFVGQIPRSLIAYSDNQYTNCTQKDSWKVNSQVVAFRVTQTGNHTVTSSALFTIFSSSTFDCSTFVGSNANFTSNQAIERKNSRTLTLNACTTYYAIIYSFTQSETANLSFIDAGSSEIIDVQADLDGFGYTYVAINQANNQIAAVSASSNFTSLPVGNFVVYGLSYANGFDTNTLLNKTISQLYALNSCLLLSENSKLLIIITSPCSIVLTLVNPTDNITSGNVIIPTYGKIIASNYITGAGTKASYQAKTIELNAGFKAETGAVFKAEIGGCN